MTLTAQTIAMRCVFIFSGAHAKTGCLHHLFSKLQFQMIVIAALEKNGEWVAIEPNTQQLQFPKWHESLARLAAMKVATHHEVPYGSISLRQSSKHIVGISWWVAFKVKRMRELTMNGSDWRLIWSMMEWVFCHWWGLAGSLSSWEGKGLWVWLACGVKMGGLLSLLLFWKWRKEMWVEEFK